MKVDEKIRSRAAALVEKGEGVAATHRPNPPNVIGFPTLNTSAYAEWQSQSLAFLEDLLGRDHSYVDRFRKQTEEAGYSGSAHAGIGILRAVLEDIEEGHIETIRSLIAAEVFSDFFDMADHLLEQGYKDPGVSLVGAVHENGLHLIAERRGVKTRAKDGLSSLNQKLAANGVYSRLVQKKVAVWIDLRNAADHGRFDDFSAADAKDMATGVRTLLADHL